MGQDWNYPSQTWNRTGTPGKDTALSWNNPSLPWRAGSSSGADVTPPTITSSDTASVAENAALSHALTANESVTWSLVGGADQARFELSGSTLRWLSDGTKDFEIPDDADTNNTYVVTVRATDDALNTADQTITVTVTDVAEDIVLAFTDSDSSATDSNTYTFSAVSLGTANQDRQIIVVVGSRIATSANVDSMTIGGVAATLILQQQSTTPSNTVAIFIAAVPTGATGDVVVNLSATVLRCGIAVFSKIGGGTAASSSGGSVAANPTATLTIPANGIAVAGGITAANSTWTPTNLTEDIEINLGAENTTLYSAHSITPGETVMTITPVTSTNPAGVFATWGL